MEEINENPINPGLVGILGGKSVFLRFLMFENLHKPLSNKKAGDRIRTDDVQLGKLAFYH